MASALLLRLVRDDYLAPAERHFDLLAALADHHDALLGAELVDPVEEVKQQRPACDRVKHLVGVRAHSRALPGGKDHDCKAALVGHDELEWHGGKVFASVHGKEKGGSFT